MIIQRTDRSFERLENLSDTEVLEHTERAMRDGDVKRIVITPNRHERRKRAALERRESKKSSK